MHIPPETKPVIWGAIGGAIAVAAIGFTWGGWMTEGTANQRAMKLADVAVVKALAPICAEKFQQQPDAVANLNALRATTSYQQAAFIEKGGWATLPGSDKPYSGTARACATILTNLQQ